MCGTVTRINPAIEKTSKVSAGMPSTSRTNRLTRPARGLKRFTNAIAVRKGGVRYETTAVRWMNPFAGTFVRLTAQASGRPMATLSTAVAAPRTSELRSACT